MSYLEDLKKNLTQQLPTPETFKVNPEAQNQTAKRMLNTIGDVSKNHPVVSGGLSLFNDIKDGNINNAVTAGASINRAIAAGKDRVTKDFDNTIGEAARQTGGFLSGLVHGDKQQVDNSKTNSSSLDKINTSVIDTSVVNKPDTSLSEIADPRVRAYLYAKSQVPEGSTLGYNETGGEDGKGSYYSKNADGTEMLIRPEQWQKDLASGKLLQEAQTATDARYAREAEEEKKLATLNNPQTVQSGGYFEGYRNGRDWQGFDSHGYDKDGWTRAEVNRGYQRDFGTLSLDASPEETAAWQANVNREIAFRNGGKELSLADMQYNADLNLENLKQAEQNRRRLLMENEANKRAQLQAISSQKPTAQVLTSTDNLGNKTENVFDLNEDGFYVNKMSPQKAIPTKKSQEFMLKNKGNKSYEAQYLEMFGNLPY